MKRSSFIHVSVHLSRRIAKSIPMWVAGDRMSQAFPVIFKIFQPATKFHNQGNTKRTKFEPLNIISTVWWWWS